MTKLKELKATRDLDAALADALAADAAWAAYRADASDAAWIAELEKTKEQGEHSALQ